VGYTIETAQRAWQQLEELAELKKLPRGERDQREVDRKCRAVLRLTGAPSIQAAAIGVQAFRDARAKINEARASGKPNKLASALKPARQAKVPKRDRSELPRPITVVQAGLPETRR
jgi:hypothetical protein